MLDIPISALNFPHLPFPFEDVVKQTCLKNRFIEGMVSWGIERVKAAKRNKKSERRKYK
ncbi:hypothetical protein, unlikely [Trypanosoma brucei brucei TREU927]|uniref:Uncharacterized protein n=1 Tax=Trypanosoma brucei brucei (strain 927/4 GUTat10.1) TaxID=185431 RepID=Q38F95_TRYB2|nr:hypothetical protein, unlikely [Trypanosoma brucei brucei TREU927]EAN76525.1 hypothetical protein, unlikely [Trypanosoma brucei brucei TREU927]